MSVRFISFKCCFYSFIFRYCVVLKYCNFWMRCSFW